MPFDPTDADPTDADLDDVARRARVGDAVRDRHRFAATEARRTERITMASALLGALDRSVTIHVTAGPEPFTGTVLAVGDDVVELTSPARTWWFRLGEITALEAPGPAAGDPGDRSTTSLVELLTDLVDADLPVTVLTRGGPTFHGTVHSLGAALWLRQQHPERTTMLDLDHVVGVARRG